MTELSFKGKEFVYNHHLAVPFRPLQMHPDKGIGDPGLDGNLDHGLTDMTHRPLDNHCSRPQVGNLLAHLHQFYTRPL